MTSYSECGDIFLLGTKTETGNQEEIRNDAYEIGVGDGAHLTVLYSPVITTSVT